MLEVTGLPILPLVLDGMVELFDDGTAARIGAPAEDARATIRNHVRRLGRLHIEVDRRIIPDDHCETHHLELNTQSGELDRVNPRFWWSEAPPTTQEDQLQEEAGAGHRLERRVAVGALALGLQLGDPITKLASTSNRSATPLTQRGDVMRTLPR